VLAIAMLPALILLIMAKSKVVVHYDEPLSSLQLSHVKEEEP
jgi:hypothetical protein